MKKYKANIINFKELRENAEVYIREVKKGQSFLVMRRSTPIFRITPPDEGIQNKTLKFSKGKIEGVSVEKLLELIQSHGSKSKISKKTH